MVDIDQLECGCCYELLVDPSTLTCGHSFCRYCLAKWYNTSKKSECPECRQTWTGAPKINVHLRSIIEKSFPEMTKVRKDAQRQSDGHEETLKKFDELSNKTDAGGIRLPNINVEQLQTLFKLLIVALVIICALVSILCICYYIFFSGPSSSDVIFVKPVEKWSSEEVAAWVHGITLQLNGAHSERFLKARIDGALLLSLVDEDLQSPPLNITNILHRKMVMGEIDKLKENRVKKPSNFWDYQRAHRENSLFLLFMLQEYPRLTFVYLHYMEYETIFRPLVQVIMDQRCDQNKSCMDERYSISTGMLLKFYVRVVLIPYEIMARFAVQFIHAHYITMWLIISHCVMLTFIEVRSLTRLPEWRFFFRTNLQNIGYFLLTCLWYWFLLSITPSFVCNIVFFGKLYYGPLETANSIRSGHFRTHLANKIKNLVVTTYRNIFRLFLRPRGIRAAPPDVH